jgi:hypothetical protein
MDFRFDTDANDMNIFNRAPSAGDLGVSGAQRLTPGSAAESIVHLRMTRRDADAMPLLGSTVVDSQNAVLIEGWIDGLLSCP